MHMNLFVLQALLATILAVPLDTVSSNPNGDVLVSSYQVGSNDCDAVNLTGNPADPSVAAGQNDLPSGEPGAYNSADETAALPNGSVSSQSPELYYGLDTPSDGSSDQGYFVDSYSQGEPFSYLPDGVYLRQAHLACDGSRNYKCDPRYETRGYYHHKEPECPRDEDCGRRGFLRSFCEPFCPSSCDSGCERGYERGGRCERDQYDPCHSSYNPAVPYHSYGSGGEGISRVIPLPQGLGNFPRYEHYPETTDLDAYTDNLIALYQSSPTPQVINPLPPSRNISTLSAEERERQLARLELIERQLEYERHQLIQREQEAQAANICHPPAPAPPPCEQPNNCQRHHHRGYHRHQLKNCLDNLICPRGICDSIEAACDRCSDRLDACLEGPECGVDYCRPQPHCEPPNTAEVCGGYPNEMLQALYHERYQRLLAESAAWKAQEWARQAADTRRPQAPQPEVVNPFDSLTNGNSC